VLGPRGSAVARRGGGGYQSGVDELGFPDLHHARAAEGWLELGNPADAARELRRLSEEARQHPDVLEVSWRLFATRQRWTSALTVARRLTRKFPARATGWIHQSYTLHELKRTPEAWRLLLPVAERFPDDSTIPYNLACYACQMGDVAAAKLWLGRAAKQRGRDEVRAMGLDDPDLEPLRGYLEGDF